MYVVGFDELIVVLLGLVETIYDCSNYQVEDQPSGDDLEGHEERNGE